MYTGWISVALPLFLVIGHGDADLIRLVPGTYAGRLEIYHGDEWGTVCDDGFDMNDAKVVCRAFGLNALSVKASAHYGQGSGTIMMDDLACSGSETALDQCGHRGWRSHNCGHGEDVGVECVAVPGQLLNQGPARTRLISPSAGGRLEVFVQSWGTVCRDRFDGNDAKTACRGLGLPTSYAYVVPTSFFGSGSGEIWVDELQCSGSEASIDSCPRSTWGVHNCNHHKDVGIFCASTISEVLRYTSVSLSVDKVQVLSGTSQAVTCNVKTPLNSTLTYTWTVGGIVSGSSSTFTKVLVSTDNDKELECSVRSGDSELGKASVSLTVLYPPDVSCQHEYYFIQGTDREIMCSVDAMPSPSSLTWSRGVTNKTSLHGQHFGLKILNVRSSDGGVYECHVANTMIVGAGTGKTGNGSCTINVEILYPPPSLRFGSIAVFEASSANLTFPFSSNPPPILYKWRKEGLDFNFTTTIDPPTITNIGRSDAGTYVITATNIMNDTQAGQVEGHGMHVVSLNVLYPPEVFCQKDVSVLLKSTFDLTCTVSASPLPDDVTWTRLSAPVSTVSPEPYPNYSTPSGSGEMWIVQDYGAKDTEEGSGDDMERPFSQKQSNTSINPETEENELSSMNTSRVGGAESAESKPGTYHVKSAAATDAGVYKCSAVNTMSDHAGRRETGTGSCLTNLNVLYPPPPLMRGTKGVFEGASVILSLPPRSNPPPDVYTWKRDMDEPDASSITPPVISNIRRSDAGQYIITVTNSMNLTHGGMTEGHGVQLVQINVLYSPVLSCRDEYVVIQGTSVSLECSVDASPPPSLIRWRLEASDKTLMTGDKFTIDDVQLTDGGVYVCTATNSMTDYEGHVRTGTGSCAVRVKVVSRETAGCPLDNQKSYHPLQLHIILIVVGVFVIVIVLVVTVISLQRKLKNPHDESIEQNGDIPLTEIPGVTTLIYKQM